MSTVPSVSAGDDRVVARLARALRIPVEDAAAHVETAVARTIDNAKPVGSSEPPETVPSPPDA